jgi:hypothetical protein
VRSLADLKRINDSRGRLLPQLPPIPFAYVLQSESKLIALNRVDFNADVLKSKYPLQR